MLKRLEKLEGLFAKQTLICQVRVCSAVEGLEGGEVEAADAGLLGQGQHYPSRRKDTVPLGPPSQRMPKCSVGKIAKRVVKRFSHWKM